MNCDEFRRHWSDWYDDWLETGAARMASHRDTCPACQRYDSQMRRMLAEYAHLPPPTESEQAELGARSRSMRRNVPRWAALAATLILGIVLGAVLRDGVDDSGGSVVAEPVRLERAGERRIAVAFDSPRTLESVEFVVELPPGVELRGFPDQRTVRWQGRLAEGRSRLQLPLVVTPDAADGQLVTRIVHGDSERRLVVPLDTPA